MIININGMLQAPISWIGSKRREVHTIEKYDPGKFNVMLDVFGGGGSVALHYLQTTDAKVYYNDIDPHVCGLYNTLKDEEKTKQLISDIHQIPIDDDTFQEKLSRYPEDVSIAEWAFLKKVTFRGMLGTTKMMDKRNGVARKPNCNKYRLYPDVLNVPRFNILNMNALDVLEKVKYCDDIFVYLDPPYLRKGTLNDYKRARLADIKSIVEFIKDPETKCKVMLHIDFTGWVYGELKDHIIHYYPSRYNMWHHNELKDAMMPYQVICANYKPRAIPEQIKEETPSIN